MKRVFLSLAISVISVFNVYCADVCHKTDTDRLIKVDSVKCLFIVYDKNDNTLSIMFNDSQCIGIKPSNGDTLLDCIEKASNAVDYKHLVTMLDKFRTSKIYGLTEK